MGIEARGPPFTPTLIERPTKSIWFVGKRRSRPHCEFFAGFSTRSRRQTVSSFSEALSSSVAHPAILAHDDDVNTSPSLLARTKRALRYEH
jgi:hypothetical protein